MRNKIFIEISLLLSLAAGIPALAQEIPARPKPERLVNDLASVLSSSDAASLEAKLVAFDDSTSTQIAIVIVDDLQGYDRSEYAHKLASEWGVGQKGKNNGIMVLVKPKTTSSDGKVFIEPGYGLEGVIPDLACSDIIEREMIPRFKENDYYGGLDAGTNVLMALASKEFSANGYHKKGHSEIPVAGIIFIVILLIIVLSSSSNSGNKNIGSRGTSSLPFWMLMGGLGGSSSGGGWGSSSGGGGGGFGGFGGGSFGGGGAGGSW
jgi:uncharacterized protein